MKAAPFDYIRPQTLAEAIAILAEDEEARPIAGGQTLVPMMAMRLARPTKLVDIARLPELNGATHDAGDVVLGAAAGQSETQDCELTPLHLPLLAAALPWVGHAPTRNRGTLGGSVANSDPAAEIPLVLVALQGSIMVQGMEAERRVPASEFFTGPMMNCLEQGELVTALRFPIWPGGGLGVGFHEVSARRSDFAYVSAAAQVQLGDDGKCTRCTVAIGGAPPVPTRLDEASAALAGTALSDDDIDSALRPAIDGLEVMTDGHASPGYRRRVARELARRALCDARDNAKTQIAGGGGA